MTSRALIDPHSAERLAKLCGMLGSEHDGERATAAAKADAFVRSLGLTWPDIIAPSLVPHVPWIRSPAGETDWQRMASFCHAHRWTLSQKERAFIDGVRAWREPTDRQKDWLTAIFARVSRECAR
jgi:hypothetical protein